MSEYVSAPLRRAVAERAHHYCEYCGVPDSATFLPHEPDHVIAIQHGGETTIENLAYACFECNRLKGPNLSSVDPVTHSVATLFNPRSDRWADHFRRDEAIIEGMSPSGRATVSLLRFNLEERVRFRANLIERGVSLGGA